MSFATSARLALATLAVGGATLAATAATSTPAEAHRRVILRTGFVYRAPILVTRFAPVATVVVAPRCGFYRYRYCH